MGFLNLSAWRPIGGKRLAERRARSGFAQPPRYYYDHLRDFQAFIDNYYEEKGERPSDVAELYLWHLEKEDVSDDATGEQPSIGEAGAQGVSQGGAEARARDVADLYSYYDIEPNSLLA